ncbi:hypothetical protein ACIRSS_18820 [Amycolatopsis sp. NPDC101161]
MAFFSHAQGMAVHLEREQSALASSGLTEPGYDQGLPLRFGR